MHSKNNISNPKVPQHSSSSSSNQNNHTIKMTFWHKIENFFKHLFIQNSEDDRVDREQEYQYILYDKKRPWASFIKFLGPGYLIAVGYMDRKLYIIMKAGNWATDLGAGSQFGYTLLFVVLLSNLLAILFQYLCMKLGIITNLDLAQHCQNIMPKYLNYLLYIFAEIAIMATDLAEVIGSAIALFLLLQIPLHWGVLITGLDVLIILRWWHSKHQPIYEKAVFVLVLTVGICFILQLVQTKPDFGEVMKGYIPSAGIFNSSERLFMAIGIIGATVMPHNLYLHSNVCQLRRIYMTQDAETIELETIHTTSSSSPISLSPPQNAEYDQLSQASSSQPKPFKPQFNIQSAKITLQYAFYDTLIALTLALVINSTILIVGSSAFYKDGQQVDVKGLEEAYASLNQYVGNGTGILFALALLISGQSSTITGTMAGQIIMSGFLNLKMKPVFRRLLTRLFSILPALITVLITGQKGLNQLLLLSQVILSVQLPFAILPLVYFTSSLQVMSSKANEPFDWEKEKAYWKSYFFTWNKESTTIPTEPPSAIETEQNDTAPTLNIVTNAADVLQNERLYHLEMAKTFVNPKWLFILSLLCSLLLVCLNVYLVISSILNPTSF